MNKLKQLMEMAQKIQGDSFWADIFDQNSSNFMVPYGKKEQPNIQPKYPLADVLRGSYEIVVLIDLSGVRKEDVHLTLQGKTLFIKGNATPQFPEYEVVTTERMQGSFEKSIPLPEEPYGNKIHAKFVNGLLEIRIPIKTKPRENIVIE
ncbi:Hsp20/alpha crystallin family protein [Ammoniphilus sp. CFH 90114]|uniref:Hsp20/alpha crystallin family protein n=1 Tax=Ammoniphilus sp. CFH 90114 TaxID=2493665 RepID=UPI0013E98AA6|nr:Hsp20/alpha crystallin family protein [Ammoniphilus sp. CFH 90114]